LTLSPRIEVRFVAPHEHAKPLSLLEKYMRDGKPVPPSFAQQLQRVIERGDLEVFAARTEERLVGIAVLAFRPNVSAGTLFASIEDLYVRPDTRHRGVGQALLEAMEERCKVRRVSYVEVQTDDEAAQFYSMLGYEPQRGVRVLSRSFTL
jgi:GNAT superfamily N-acetyltransferase